VETFDGTAITVPLSGNDVKAMEAEFFRTLGHPKLFPGKR
jgi:hypothetical protein